LIPNNKNSLKPEIPPTIPIPMITQKLYSSSSSSKNSNKKEHNHEPHKQKINELKLKAQKI
jgi:hypothetical protein